MEVGNGIPIDKRVADRLECLIANAAALESARDALRQVDDIDGRIVDGRKLEAKRNGFIASAQHLLETIFPSPTNAHRNRAATVVARTGNDAAASVAAILEAVRDDLTAGVVRAVATAAQDELFDDFLDHAEHYLGAKKVAPAGVIAGVVFEDTLRRICDRLAIHQKGIDLDKLISELAKREVLNPVGAKRARAAAGLRTSATHAQWDEFGAGDVEAAIKITRELIERSVV